MREMGGESLFHSLLITTRLHAHCKITVIMTDNFCAG